jgi:lipopolysaccharide/colanic/teichoic acid biosynthesis glycosyltransferase
VKTPGLPRWVEAPIAAGVLAASAPLIALGAVAMAMTSAGPVIFRQQRMGRGGRPFTMYKLRTMAAMASGPSVTAAGDRRITPAGRILRKLKIDELPELWNVVIGDMRLVGPRPEVPALVDLQSPLWAETLAGAPGITDPMTLKLRDEESLLRAAGGDCEQFYKDRLQPYKLRGYVDYQRRRTWRSDLLVLMRTAAAVVRLPGAAADSTDVLREITGELHAAAKPLS